MKTNLYFHLESHDRGREGAKCYGQRWWHVFWLKEVLSVLLLSSRYRACKPSWCDNAPPAFQIPTNTRKKSGLKIPQKKNPKYVRFTQMERWWSQNTDVGESLTEQVNTNRESTKHGGSAAGEERQSMEIWRSASWWLWTRTLRVGEQEKQLLKKWEWCCWAETRARCEQIDDGAGGGDCACADGKSAAVQRWGSPCPAGEEAAWASCAGIEGGVEQQAKMARGAGGHLDQVKDRRWHWEELKQVSSNWMMSCNCKCRTGCRCAAPKPKHTPSLLWWELVVMRQGKGFFLYINLLSKT